MSEGVDGVEKFLAAEVQREQAGVDAMEQFAQFSAIARGHDIELDQRTALFVYTTLQGYLYNLPSPEETIQYKEDRFLLLRGKVPEEVIALLDGFLPGERVTDTTSYREALAKQDEKTREFKERREAMRPEFLRKVVNLGPLASVEELDATMVAYPDLRWFTEQLLFFYSVCIEQKEIPQTLIVNEIERLDTIIENRKLPDYWRQIVREVLADFDD